jgi:hypothetical protein
MPTGSDSFNRADAATLGTTDTGQAWSVEEGAGWSIETNKATPTTPSTATFNDENDIPLEIAVVDVGTNRQTITVDVITHPDNANAGIIGRFIDTDNYFYFPVINTTISAVQFWHVAGGTFQGYLVNESVTIDLDATYTLELVLNGNAWSLSVTDDTATVISSHSSTFAIGQELLAGNACGIATAPGLFIGSIPSDEGSKFDNFTFTYGTRRNLRALGLRR